MDGLIFSKLMSVLNKILSKSKLNRISVVGGSIYFSFYSGGTINFEFRTSPTPPALFNINDISGDSIGALAAVAGATVSEISSYGYERAGYIELKKRKPSGKLMTYRAILEPAGNYANFLLTDEEGVILYSLSSRTIDPDRNIGAGGNYTKPRPNKKYSLDNFQGAESFSELAGFYPVTAKYADNMAGEIGFSQTALLIKEAVLSDTDFYIDKSNKVIPFHIPDSVKTITWQELGEYYPKKETGSTSRAGDSIKKMFTAKRDKYLRLAEKLEKELVQARLWSQPAAEAELLKSNLHILKGSGDYTLSRYTEKGEELVPYKVEYGENISLKADKLFNKATRLKKSITFIEDRLEEAFQMALSAEEQVYYAENNLDSDESVEFERLIAIEGKGGKKKDKRIMKKPFYEAVFEGYRIFAGRSSVSNHELVFKYGNDTDIWFHGRNIPSAHVLLRLDGGVKLSEEHILKSAAVAAGFSKMKNQSKVDVDYTFRKYVNKPKNTPAGFVTYKKFQTVTVEPFSVDTLDEMFKFEKE